MNILRYLTPSYWRQRRREKANLQLLSNVAASVAEIKGYINKNLIYWQPRQRQYVIEQVIADFYLSSPRLWDAFMKMLAYYAMDERTIEARKNAEIEVGAKAVREANSLPLREGRGGSLTKADTERIRRNAVDNMPPTGFVTVEEFHFAIVRATAPSVAEATEANGQLVIVGHYDIDGKLEIALWEDVKHNLQKKD